MNKESEVSKMAVSLEKVESSISNFMNHDESTMTYDIDTSKNTVDMGN